MRPSSALSFLILLLLALIARAFNAEDEDEFEYDLDDHISPDSPYYSPPLQQNTFNLIEDIEDDDEESPPGLPDGFVGQPTQPFSTTYNDQVTYNLLLQQRMYTKYQSEYFAAYGGKDTHNDGGLHQTSIARPNGSTTGYYTGVSHFVHTNNDNLVTFVFSAGRHDGGTNTYFTIDVSSVKKQQSSKGGTIINPFLGVQEQYINKYDVSPWTWVDTYSYTSPNQQYPGPPKHYVLFSGGASKWKIGPSKLYIFEEHANGTLVLPPKVDWIEDTSILNGGSARFCLLVDLGNIFDETLSNDNPKYPLQLSRKGYPDIVIAGTAGLYIYSKHLEQEKWTLIRSIELRNEYDVRVNDDTAAFVGVQDLQDGRHLIISARTKWKNYGQTSFDAPTLVYDYQKDDIVQRVGSMGQTVSVALLDDKSRVVIGAGGQSGHSGQPNLIYDVIHKKKNERENVEPPSSEPRFLKRRRLTERRPSLRVLVEDDEMSMAMMSMSMSMPTTTDDDQYEAPADEGHQVSLVLSDTQLARDMPTNYTPFQLVSPIPVSSEEYFVVPAPGNTKTRQVLSFRVGGDDDTTGGADLVLEINSAQTCNIYYRRAGNETASKVMPLPGSEGENDYDRYYYSRAGDALVVEDQVYIILTQFNGNNTVYSFSTDVFGV